MSQQKKRREIKMVDVINVGAAVQKFEIVVGVDGVRSYSVAPGEIVQVEDGYTESLERAAGRRKSIPILQQLAPNMRRVDEVEPEKLAAITAGKRKPRQAE